MPTFFDTLMLAQQTATACADMLTTLEADEAKGWEFPAEQHAALQRAQQLLAMANGEILRHFTKC